MKHRIAFRVDASTDIGWGHVMRCLTLAQTLSSRLAECEFVCRRHSGHLVDRIERRGFRVHLLETDPARLTTADDGSLPAHSSWLGTGWREDAEQTLAILARLTFDWVVVDHYGLDARWHRLIRPATRNLLAIDDLADRRLDADWVLDQNLGRTPSDYDPWTLPGVRYLLGPRHALLRPEFAERRTASLERRLEPELSNLLVTLGGTDRLNFTPRIVRTVLEHPLSRLLHLTVVLGRQAPGLDAVRAMQERYSTRLTLKCEVEDMANLMTESDLCIGAAGSTAWERCCLGVPTLQVVIADNQRSIARALADVGAAITLEADRLEESLIETLNALTPDALRRMSFAARDLCDGLGAERVADSMLRDRSGV